MNVLTHRPLPSAVIEMSTGSGTFAGSPIVPTSLACQRPAASCFTSHSFDVSAVAVIAQFWSEPSAQRISSGAPGTAKICAGSIVLWFHSTIVPPNCAMAFGSLTTSPSSRM